MASGICRAMGELEMICFGEAVLSRRIVKMEDDVT